MVDVGAWLRGLGLGRYEQVFGDNDVDGCVLPGLTAEDLEQIGVASVGHRRLLLRAIADLAATMAPAGRTAPPDAERIVHTTATAPAERRQLTVMFVDLVGSTALATRLDPEELRAIMRAYYDACADIIARPGGHVAKFMGDGILAYFGWPMAHEDAAERAVRAGLQIVETMPRVVTAGTKPLAARVGIATGLAVVGDVPNLAARLQQLAAPGTVIIADDTRRLLGGDFDLVGLAGVTLRGLPAPVQAWQVAGERARAASRFEARRAGGLAPLVGREQELALLLERWQLAGDGHGQVVLLTGEPGGGKSRLAEALDEQLTDEPHTRLLYQCSPQHTGTALFPIIAQLEHSAGFRRADEAAIRHAKLRSLLTRIGSDALTLAPPLAALLAIPANGGQPSEDVSPRQVKERSFEALLGLLQAIAARQPVLLVFEDLHWVDPTSLDLLRLLLELVPTLPVLAILTTRPAFAPTWPIDTPVVPLPLDRLLPPQAAALAECVSGKPLPPELLEQIVARTDGVPLFVEELTRAVLEAGLLEDAGDRYRLSHPLPAMAIPTTLQDSLMARLDRLGTAKELAQFAACLGREFSHDVLAATADRDEAFLRAALDRLVDSGLVIRLGRPGAARYSFRHALVQETAYGSLLKSRRQTIHAHIAEMLTKRFPDIAESRPEWLAQHYMAGGRGERAAEHWLRAARRAKAAFANAEAEAHLHHCLAAVEAGRRAGDGNAREGDGPALDALVLLGDLASLAGDLEGANRRYEQALAIAGEPPIRQRIERRRHRPRSAVRNGGQLAFYEHGSGVQTLLFVAPLAYGLAALQPLVEQLCQEFRVVTVDARGTGNSDPLRRPYPLSEHVADTRAVIEALGGGPVIGVGISRGGNLLLRLAHAEPRLFSKLATIGCPPGQPEQFFAEAYLRLNRGLLDKGDIEGIVSLHTTFVFSEPATRELRDLFVRSRLELPKETLFSFFDPDPTIEVTPMLGEIAVPVLVTHGGDDRLVDLAAAEFILARVPDARLHIFEGKGHLPLFTATAEFWRVLRDFVTNPTAAPTSR